MALYENIYRRNKKYTSDQEFEVGTYDDFGDGIFRGYNQSKKIKKESEIIKEINSGVDYRTDKTTTVNIGNRNGVEYIYSTPNGSDIDNIINLPKY